MEQNRSKCTQDKNYLLKGLPCVAHFFLRIMLLRADGCCPHHGPHRSNHTVLGGQQQHAGLNREAEGTQVGLAHLQLARENRPRSSKNARMRDGGVEDHVCAKELIARCHPQNS